MNGDRRQQALWGIGAGDRPINSRYFVLYFLQDLYSAPLKTRPEGSSFSGLRQGIVLAHVQLACLPHAPSLSQAQWLLSCSRIPPPPCHSSCMWPIRIWLAGSHCVQISSHNAPSQQWIPYRRCGARASKDLCLAESARSDHSNQI